MVHINGQPISKVPAMVAPGAGSLGARRPRSAITGEVEILCRLQDRRMEVLDQPKMEVGPDAASRDLETWSTTAMVNSPQTQQAFGIRFKSVESGEFVAIRDFVTIIERKGPV